MRKCTVVALHTCTGWLFVETLCAVLCCDGRLVYEANPLALLCEQAGGTAMDGKVGAAAPLQQPL
jgi:hypothetical protein